MIAPHQNLRFNVVGGIGRRVDPDATGISKMEEETHSKHVLGFAELRRLSTARETD